MLHETANLPPIISIKLFDFSDLPPYSKNLPSEGLEIIPLSSISSDETPLVHLIPKNVHTRLRKASRDPIEVHDDVSSPERVPIFVSTQVPQTRHHKHHEEATIEQALQKSMKKKPSPVSPPPDSSFSHKDILLH